MLFSLEVKEESTPPGRQPLSWVNQLQQATKTKLSFTEASQLLEASRGLAQKYYRQIQEIDPSQEDTIAAMIPLPVPPVRRIQRKMGKWWVWMPENVSPEKGVEYHWKKLPMQCQQQLDESVKSMRPTIASALMAGINLQPNADIITVECKNN